MDGAAVEREVFSISSADEAGPSSAPTGGAEDAADSRANGTDFIVGPENRLVGSAILGFLNHDSYAYSPFVLCGPSGVGKSCLAQHIARLRQQAFFMRGTDFAHELATAVNQERVEEFRTKYRGVGMFVLEDLWQLTGHRAALQELQHLLDELEAREVPVLITSRLPPAEFAELPPALRSRLKGGLIVKVSPPGTAARQKILQRWAAARGISLSVPACRLLAEKLNLKAPELRGIVTELEMEQRCRGTHHGTLAIELDVVRKFLSHRRAQRRPSLNQVSVLVAKYYGLKPPVLSSPSRRRQAVLARAMAIYLARTLCGASLNAIGKHFGGRDHSTVLHNFRQLQGQLAHDAQLSGAVDHLQHALVGN
jgi:chromosomal replication initiator protein